MKKIIISILFIFDCCFLPIKQGVYLYSCQEEKVTVVISSPVWKKAPILQRNGKENCLLERSGGRVLFLELANENIVKKSPDEYTSLETPGS